MKKKSIQTKPVLDLISQSKENRNKFLAPYKEKYLDAKKRLYEVRFLKYRGVLTAKQAEEKERGINKVEKEIAEIISTLIELEPSHLAEPWILWQVIEWMYEHRFMEFLEKIFLRQGKRRRPSENKIRKHTYDFFLTERIDTMINKFKITDTEAFRRLAQQQEENPVDFLPKWNESKPNQQLELLIKKKYYAYKRSVGKSKDDLPFPYYGRDIVNKENI